jgi:hypothetical protein
LREVKLGVFNVDEKLLLIKYRAVPIETNVTTATISKLLIKGI